MAQSNPSVASLSRLIPSSLLAFSLLFSAQAFAQDEEAGEGEIDLEDEDDLEALQDEQDTDTLELKEEPVEEASEPPVDKSKKGEVQLLMGMRYRALVTPKFLINMFGVDGGRTLFVNGVGPEIGGYFGSRDNGFMVMFSPWIAYYGMQPTPVKGKNDPDTAWEIVESEMQVWYLTVDTLWDHRIVDRLSFQIGGSFGVGIVGGDLIRNEAYMTGGPPDGDIPALAPCIDRNNPNSVECPADGNYGVADRWPVYPWVNFQMGLRYQPIDEFVGRFEMGLGSSGIWFGLAADYSLFL